MRLSDLLLLLGTVNYSLIFGRLSYDERDGEICFEYALPTDGAKITFDQFDHVLRAIIVSTDTWGKRVGQLVRGERTVESILRSHYEKMGLGPDDLLRILGRLLRE